MSEVFSIEIREGVYVRFHGIPWDLTRSEAAKVGAVIVALGSDSSAPASAEHLGEAPPTVSDEGPGPNPKTPRVGGDGP